ncbi:hypothetical protein [Nocardia gipuzkoensis]
MATLQETVSGLLDMHQAAGTSSERDQIRDAALIGATWLTADHLRVIAEQLTRLNDRQATQ